MKRTLAILLALLSLLALCGCGSKSADMSAYSTAYEAQEEYYAEPAAMAMDSASGGYAAVGATEAAGEQVKTASAGSAVDTDKIIYSCSAEVETYDFDKSCAAVYEMIDAVGGFLQSSSVNGNYYGRSGSRTAYFTIRIPRERFDDVTGSLSELGNVPSCSVQAENITASYRDTESRLKTYQTEEDRLLAMLEKAETVEDMLAIEDRLAEVRYNIESLTSTLMGWDSLVNYSSIDLTVREVEEYTETAEPSYWQSVKTGLSRSLRGLGEFFKDFLRWLVAALPVIIVLAVLALVVLLFVRLGKKRRAKRRAAKAARLAAKQEAPKTPDKPAE